MSEREIRLKLNINAALCIGLIVIIYWVSVLPNHNRAAHIKIRHLIFNILSILHIFLIIFLWILWEIRHYYNFIINLNDIFILSKRIALLIKHFQYFCRIFAVQNPQSFIYSVIKFIWVLYVASSWIRIIKRVMYIN